MACGGSSDSDGNDGLGLEALVDGLEFGESEGARDASIIRDVILEYARRKKDPSKSKNKGQIQSQNVDESYWKQKLGREKGFMQEARAALQRDKESVKWSQSDLARRKDAWRRQKGDMAYRTGNPDAKHKLRLLGEALNRKTTELNRMVEDIRWTQTWLAERERKLNQLERLVHSRREMTGVAGFNEVMKDIDNSPAALLSTLETEMETDLTFFELSACENYELSDDSADNMEPRYRGGKTRGLGSHRVPVAPPAALYRAPSAVPSAYHRDAWIMPPTPQHSTTKTVTIAEKENTGNVATTLANGKRPVSSTATSSTAQVQSEIQKFASQVQLSTEAYDDHAEWLSKLRVEIGKNVHKLHKDSASVTPTTSLRTQLVASSRSPKSFEI